MTSQELDLLQKNHVAAWNERDRTERDKLIATIYADDIRMYDRDLVLSGSVDVSDFIGRLHTDDPNFNFSPAKPIESSQNGVRLYGQIETSGGLLHSMDFFIMENGKARHLYVFMDRG